MFEKMKRICANQVRGASMVALMAALIFTPLIGRTAGTAISGENRGHALIVGNSRYQLIAPLSNPANDATDIAATLETLGFEVTLKIDATQRTMENEILQFGRKLRKGGVGLFYFAGHGIQIAGRNYLIPIDANVDSESDIKFETVDAGRILGKMEDAGNGINIIILDACRNNPFKSKFRAMKEGLAKMEAPTGSILAYSTAPGSVAADGDGRNGLYTSKLLKYIKKKGLSIEDCFKKVRIEVMEASAKSQVPWESSSLTINFYFASQKKAEGKKEVPRPSEEIEILYWESIKDSKDVKLYQSYIDEFPDGSFVKLAMIYLEKYRTKNDADAEKRISKEGKKVVIKDAPSNKKRIPYKKNGKTTKNKNIKIAFLPSKFKKDNWNVATSKFQYESALNAINSINRYEIVHSYVDNEELNVHKVWGKKTFFSNLTVDLMAVENYCQSIDADLAILMHSYRESGANHIVELYLIDALSGGLVEHTTVIVDYNQILLTIADQVTMSLREYVMRH